MALLRVPYKMLLAPIPPFALGADNTALVLIDAQHFTTSRSQGLGRLAAERGIEREFDEYYLQAEAALKNMAVLVAACRARGLRANRSSSSAAMSCWIRTVAPAALRFRDLVSRGSLRQHQTGWRPLGAGV